MKYIAVCKRACVFTICGCWGDAEFILEPTWSLKWAVGLLCIVAMIWYSMSRPLAPVVICPALNYYIGFFSATHSRCQEAARPLTRIRF